MENKNDGGKCYQERSTPAKKGGKRIKSAELIAQLPMFMACVKASRLLYGLKLRLLGSGSGRGAVGLSLMEENLPELEFWDGLLYFGTGLRARHAAVPFRSNAGCLSVIESDERYDSSDGLLAFLLRPSGRKGDRDQSSRLLEGGDRERLVDMVETELDDRDDETDWDRDFNLV
ncbi:hypothetical protein PRK78_001128 [Emydomyces testavorans]|uniref:Uncharacterized protein n=1 Tax=Emydomyces testavorans TaxID=2070801 RepID=A0AAF0DCE3_9EURO|nr:hypothetical protein PRK78_001128 [Emydomyces testavorans]